MLTPCIKVCKLEDDICIGCKRTKHQIAYWSCYSDEDRLKIMEELNVNKMAGPTASTNKLMDNAKNGT